MKKFFVPVVAVVLFGAVSANAQSASQPAKPQPKTTTAAAAQKSPAATAKTTTTAAAAQKSPAATAKTTTAPATKPANAIASTAPKNGSSATKPTDTGKPKKTHRLHKKAQSQTNASSNGAAGGTAQKSKASKQ